MKHFQVQTDRGIAGIFLLSTSFSSSRSSCPCTKYESRQTSLYVTPVGCNPFTITHHRFLQYPIGCPFAPPCTRRALVNERGGTGKRTKRWKEERYFTSLERIRHVNVKKGIFCRGERRKK